VTGLFGGAFDPPHNGHVALAEAALDRFELERLLVLVVVDPGHRPVQLDFETRFRLAELAFGELPRTEVVREEHRYTVDAVRDGTFGDAIFLVGADEFCDFLSWKEPHGVLERTRLAVATRPGFPRERLERVLEQLRAPERVLFFAMEPHPVASRDLRARIAAGEPLDGLVPPAVAEAIAEGGLYRP